MLLELSEILVCPVCGPPQVTVTVVHEADLNRVANGFLGCPACDARFRIERSVVDFTPLAASADPADEWTAASSSLLPGSAVLAAALLGLERGRGSVLVGPGAVPIAPELADLVEGREIVAVGPEIEAEAPDTATVARLSRLRLPAGVPVPLRPGCLAGAVLGGEVPPTRLGEMARLLAPGGRLVILGPGPATGRTLRESDLDLLASEERAILARRPSSAL